MEPLIASLLRPEAYDHPVGPIELLETHISWVLLTGTYAYKIKKPVHLGFIDFSTPQRRRHFCQEELRLNRRLAPELYLGLRAIHGPAAEASFRGDGPILETAVQMRQFRHQDLLPAVLERPERTASALPALFEQLADSLAHFHADAAVASEQEGFGSARQVRAPAIANLDVLERVLGGDRRLSALRHWSETQAEQLAPWFEARRAAGWIRECHGDLHLGNMALWRQRILVFDCLEFSPPLRWIDLISDMAFLVMDLRQRRRGDLAALVLNRWLEHTGDYTGLRGWRWYVVYRALVRAKVAALRLQQADQPPAELAAQRRGIQSYLALAEASAAPPPPVLLITHGISGSGKSHRALHLARRLGWIHLRSDVERKRLFGLWGLPLREVRHGDLYAADVSEQLFGDHLPRCAETVLEAGLSLIVDATFLQRRHRRHFADLARRCGARFVILDCRCPPELARRRLRARRSLGLDPSDADLTVLERQLGQREPLADNELASTLVAEASDGKNDAETLSAADQPIRAVTSGSDEEALLERLAEALSCSPAPQA
ncbi:MAG: AAA family ATPase [Cyanobium sp.]